MDITRKRWDHSLGAWVLDTATVSKPEKYWDPKTGQWEVEPTTYAKGVDKEQTIEVSSCAVPTRQLGPVSSTPEPYKPSHTSHTTTFYRTVVPWEGIDRNKWPNTWNTLFMLYHSHGWHRDGIFIDAKDWDARLKGEYPPEPPRSKYPRSYYYDYDGA